MGTEHEFDPEKEVTYEDLQLFTNNFSNNNLIGWVELSGLYRAKIPQGWRGNDDEEYVTVKMVTGGKIYRLKDEVRFLALPFVESQRIVPQVKYYIFNEGRLDPGLVYDIEVLDTIHKIMGETDKFPWRNRVKLALEFARFLKLCHVNNPRYVFRHLSAAHIVIDQELIFARIKNKLFGGVLGKSTHRHVFTPPVYELSEVYQRALYEARGYQGMKCLLIHPCLRKDPDFDEEDGTQLSMLALRCIDDTMRHRPNMEQVVSKLDNLHLVNKLAS